MNKRIINGVKIETQKKEITSCNILGVEVGTNDCQGGDAGHGIRTFFKLNDLCGTVWEIKHLIDDDNCEGVQIELQGDSELGTFVDALKFAVEVLKKKELWL